MGKVKLVIGDWSKDGHSQSDEIIYESNKSVEEIQQAYKDSCKLTGLSFNHNEDYTGLNLGYGNWRQIATEYEDSKIEPEALEVLYDHGIDLLASTDAEGYYWIDGEDDFADIIVKFIKLSLPDLELTTVSEDIPAINGWWNGNLNVQFGYGLYN